MKLIVDANIFFAALIKEGLTAEFLVDDRLDLYVPSFLFMEFRKYESTILKKTHRSKKEFQEILLILQEVLKPVSEQRYASFLEEASKVCPDKGDVPYFALALMFGCGIWSNDKKLRVQNHVDIYSTELLRNLFQV